MASRMFGGFMSSMIYCPECHKEHLKAGVNGTFIIIDGPDKRRLQNALFEGYGSEFSRQCVIFHLKDGKKVNAVINMVQRPIFYNHTPEEIWFCKGSVLFGGFSYSFKALYSPHSKKGEISF